MLRKGCQKSTAAPHGLQTRGSPAALPAPHAQTKPALTLSQRFPSHRGRDHLGRGVAGMRVCGADFAEHLGRAFAVDCAGWPLPRGHAGRVHDFLPLARAPLTVAALFQT